MMILPHGYAVFMFELPSPLLALNFFIRKWAMDLLHYVGHYVNRTVLSILEAHFTRAFSSLALFWPGKYLGDLLGDVEELRNT